jgi:L-alanine-DL-glutamate epimerase-like enolase superfamily enzyme
MLKTQIKTWDSKEPFRTSSGVWDTIETLVVEWHEGQHMARGEARGVSYLGESPSVIRDQIESVAEHIQAGIGREGLLQLLPPGGARNALDSLLWDLEAKRAGKRVWELENIRLKKITTVYSLGIEQDLEALEAKAAKTQDYPSLKVKLDRDRPVERIEIIRRVRPDALIVIDANQAWSFDQLRDVLKPLKKFGVSMIEQPLSRDDDEMLEGYKPAIPLCADESCLHGGDIERLANRYQIINIKLDKCGGLTHGLQMVREARQRGLGLMVGCMGGTSLSMAPAYVLGQFCDLHDIDGPLLLKRDCENGLSYCRGMVSPPSPRLWG